jgi:hypothetical protein
LKETFLEQVFGKPNKTEEEIKDIKKVEEVKPKERIDEVKPKDTSSEVKSIQSEEKIPMDDFIEATLNILKK